MPTLNHKCVFERIHPKLEVSIWEPNVAAIEDAIWQISLLLKGEKKAKKIMRCRKCGRYSVECPYCHALIETDSIPQEITCASCNRKIHIRT